MIESRLKIRIILPNDFVISQCVKNIKGDENPTTKKNKAIKELFDKIMIQDLKMSDINIRNITIAKIEYEQKSINYVLKDTLVNKVSTSNDMRIIQGHLKNLNSSIYSAENIIPIQMLNRYNTIKSIENSFRMKGKLHKSGHQIQTLILE